MPFKKGRSGNPGGRPKIAQEIRELALAACPKAIQTLIAQLDHPDPKVVANAASLLLDRGMSKPMQAHEVKSTSEVAVRCTVDVTNWLHAVADDLKLVNLSPKKDQVP